jgi:hypothetical protein
MNKLELYLIKTFETFLKRPAHAVVIVSPNQRSLNSALSWLADQLVEKSVDIIDVEPDGTSIKIGQIRPLYRLAYHRRSTNSAGRVIKINQAELMTLPAQNALLKLLEEPPAGIYFLLGSHDAAALTPTILSRSQVVELPRLSRQQFFGEFTELWDEAETERRFQLSQGDPLLANDIESIEADLAQAKRLLSDPLDQVFSSLSKQKPSKAEVVNWCQSLALLCQGAIAGAKTSKEANRWVDRADAVLRANQLLNANTSHKLTLNWLLLEIRH